jgi:hypothetical protein
MDTRRCNTTTERRRPGPSLAARTARLVALVLLIVPAGVARAGVADDEAKILLRAISFDRALATRAGRDVVITIVYDGRVNGDAQERDARVLSFRKLAGRTIAGLPIKIDSSDCSPPKPMSESLQGTDIVYLTRGAKDCVRAVTAATRKLRIASLASTRSLIEQGITLGVTIEGTRPKLLVNLAASKAEGVDLSSQVLQLAEVIK